MSRSYSVEGVIWTRRTDSLSYKDNEVCIESTGVEDFVRFVLQLEKDKPFYKTVRLTVEVLD